MLLIKIWGSLIAPKDKIWLDDTYLKQISAFLGQFNNIFLAHWTWNIGHWRVRELIKKNPWKDLNALLIGDFENWKKVLLDYFKNVDKYFSWFKRLSIEYFLDNDKNLFSEGRFIVWWDVIKTWNIISSDDIISDMMNYNFIEFVLILTDVNGVYDEKWNVIKKITKDNLANIKFWKKENDVTWWMKQKVLKILSSWKKAVICDWKNLENINNRIKYGHWEGTVIN